MPGPSWARDLVLTELRRSAPEDVEKDDLLGRCGIGAGDLRDTLTELMDDELVEQTDRGFRALDVEEPTGAEPEGGLPIPSDATADEDDDADEEPEPEEVDIPAAVPAPDTYFRATFEVEVVYALDEEESEDPPDVRAAKDAATIQAAAADGILERWSDLAVTARLRRLEAFDQPRVILENE
jgi:hypothetical protein